MLPRRWRRMKERTLVQYGERVGQGAFPKGPVLPLRVECALAPGWAAGPGAERGPGPEQG